MSERFLSDEDLDLANLSWEELLAWWDAWLRQAQSTNELDEHLYSHGVFRVAPGWRLGPDGTQPAPPVESGASGAARQARDG